MTHIFEAGHEKVIHVNVNNIRYNLAHDTKRPIIRVECKGITVYCQSFEALGPVRSVYSPKFPRNCGARLWLSTYGVVDCIAVGKYNESL